MGKNNTPQLPSTPTYQTDPVFQKGYQSLYDIGSQLTKGDFSGNLSWLNPTVNNNNSALALASAQGILAPQFRDTLNQITQSAAANGQLESSTFGDALARSQSDLNSQFQSIVSNQAINDSNQSNQNRLSLFGSGLDTLNQATNYGFGNQNSENQFNLNNYSNQVAAALAGQKQSNGGLLGGLMGAGGGALAGLALAPFTGGSSLLLAGLGGLAGGAAGALTPQSANVGGSLLGSGAGLLGNSMQAQQLGNLSASLRSGFSAPSAGAYASNSLTNNPYNSINLSGNNPFRLN